MLVKLLGFLQAGPPAPGTGFTAFESAEKNGNNAWKIRQIRAGLKSILSVRWQAFVGIGNF